MLQENDKEDKNRVFSSKAKTIIIKAKIIINF